MGYTFYPIAGSTLPIPFDSFDGGTGASITITGLAITDVEIYAGISMTQRASDNGIVLTDTDGIDLDGITGIQGLSLDLNDNSDAGFYVVGTWYRVVVSAITIDGQTVNFTACMFQIRSATRGLAGTALPDAAADAAGGLPISDAGGQDIDAAVTSIAAIEADTNELQTDWVNGGRLDLLLDAIQTDLDNGTDGLGALKVLIDTVNTDLSNGTDGLGALKTLIDAVNTDLANGTDGLGALKTLIDAVNTDLSNGTDGLGALKTLLDAIPTTAMRGTDGALTTKTGFALTAGERDSIAAALLDLTAGVETGLTLRQSQRLISAALAGVLAGAATNTITVKKVGGATTRITATVDSDGNRSVMVLNAA